MQHTYIIYSLLKPVGQMGEAWEPSRKNALLEIGEHWIEKYFHFISR
jgi:hypothetical protein